MIVVRSLPVAVAGAAVKVNVRSVPGAVARAAVKVNVQSVPVAGVQSLSCFWALTGAMVRTRVA